MATTYWFRKTTCMTLDCLIIKKQFLDKIIRGEKIWEIRGSSTTKRGHIGLIESGSGQIVATAELIQSHGPLSSEELLMNKDKTRIENEFNIKYKKVYAWELTNVKAIEPISYKHPQGAIIWVKVQL